MADSTSTNVPPLPPLHVREELARRAFVGEPTVRRYIRGLPGKPRLRARIEKAMREMGLSLAETGR